MGPIPLAFSGVLITAFWQGTGKGDFVPSTGIPTSVCYGFLRSLMDMMEAEKPQYAAVVFDLDQPTFRHKADETYKRRTALKLPEGSFWKMSAET